MDTQENQRTTLFPIEGGKSQKSMDFCSKLSQNSRERHENHGIFLSARVQTDPYEPGAGGKFFVKIQTSTCDFHEMCYISLEENKEGSR